MTIATFPPYKLATFGALNSRIDDVFDTLEDARDYANSIKGNVGAGTVILIFASRDVPVLGIIRVPIEAVLGE